MAFMMNPNLTGGIVVVQTTCLVADGVREDLAIELPLLVTTAVAFVPDFHGRIDPSLQNLGADLMHI